MGCKMLRESVLRSSDNYSNLTRTLRRICRSHATPVSDLDRKMLIPSLHLRPLWLSAHVSAIHRFTTNTTTRTSRATPMVWVASKHLPRPPPTLIAPIALGKQEKSATYLEGIMASNTYLRLRRPFVVNDTILRPTKPTRPDVLFFALLARPSAAETVAVHADLFVVGFCQCLFFFFVSLFFGVEHDLLPGGGG